MGSSAVLQLAARRNCSVSVEEWDSACSRTARVPPRAGCRLIYRCRMGFWEASCRGTGAADAWTGRLTAAPRPLVVGGGLIRGDSGRGLLLAAVAVAGLWGPVKE